MQLFFLVTSVYLWLSNKACGISTWSSNFSPKLGELKTKKACKSRPKIVARHRIFATWALWAPMAVCCYSSIMVRALSLHHRPGHDTPKVKEHTGQDIKQWERNEKREKSFYSNALFSTLRDVHMLWKGSQKMYKVGLKYRYLYITF